LTVSILNYILTHITEVLILVFIAITFLQSGVDKITDWKGQLVWLKGHFSKTFLGKVVPLLLSIILIIEVVAGILAFAGIYQLARHNDAHMGLYSALLAAVTLLFLLFGQRIAKDYQGAFTIVGYFIVVVFGVWLLASKV